MLSLNVEVPELLEVNPASALPGETVYLNVVGRALYLVDGLTTFAAGPDVAVEEVRVLDVDRGLVRIAVPPNASPGPRPLIVTTEEESFHFEDAFTIGEGTSIPRIVNLSPASVVQGSEVEIEATASQPFAGTVTVTVDSDLIVGGDPLVDGRSAVFRVAAVGNARPGLHDVILDDGARLWATQLEVREFRVETRSGCDTAPGPRSWWTAGLDFWSRR